MPPDVVNNLADGVAECLSDASHNGIFAAVVTNTKRRRFLKTVIQSRGISNPVLSFEEIGPDARPALVGVVKA